jgi:hypothetical protein
MPAPDDLLIPVQREWKAWRTAVVRLADLHHIHWWQPNGAPVPLVHGYVFCTSFLKGDLPHDCERLPFPHRLLVCVLKRHLAPYAHAELAQRAAGQQPLPATHAGGIGATST